MIIVIMITNSSFIEQKFKDRKIEINMLSTLLDSHRFEFIVIYGRRRIGKTTLTLYLTRNKTGIYYFAKDSTPNNNANLLDFYQTCVQKFPELTQYKPDYRILFDYLHSKVDYIIIDEFQYLLKEDSKNASIFAEIIDKFRIQVQTNLKLIVLGSSISLIKDEVLSDPSPLFGRKTVDLKLGPMLFNDLREFFPNASMRDLIEIYGYADGIPYYLEEIQPPFWDWLEMQFKSGKFPLNELEWLIRIEFREQGRYLAILEAIASGKTTNKELLNSVLLDQKTSTSLTRYLDKLILVDFIKKEFPITKDPLRSHLGRYYLADNFLQFWFKYIFPNRSAIMQRTFHTSEIQTQYSAYLGLIFEKVVKQYLIHHPPILFAQIGRWWGKSTPNTSEEIDLVAYSNANLDALAVECKWQSDVNANSVAKRLIEKAKFVEFKGVNKLKHFQFWIFAIKFHEKITEFNHIPITCVELEDMKWE